MSNLDQLTIREARELANLFGGGCDNKMPFKVGEKYFIRTVTHIDIGECVEVVGNFVRLSNAAWIADTGRYHDCLAKGVFNEVEPYPDNFKPFINTSAIIDACEWPHKLPREQK